MVWTPLLIQGWPAVSLYLSLQRNEKPNWPHEAPSFHYYFTWQVRPLLLDMETPLFVLPTSPQPFRCSVQPQEPVCEHQAAYGWISVPESQPGNSCWTALRRSPHHLKTQHVSSRRSKKLHFWALMLISSPTHILFCGGESRVFWGAHDVHADREPNWLHRWCVPRFIAYESPRSTLQNSKQKAFKWLLYAEMVNHFGKWYPLLNQHSWLLNN